jgi:hypothetical protein
VLDCTRFATRFGAPPRPWLPALARCLDRLLPTPVLGAAAQGSAR